jgi:hypothetical protein
MSTDDRCSICHASLPSLTRRIDRRRRCQHCRRAINTAELRPHYNAAIDTNMPTGPLALRAPARPIIPKIGMLESARDAGHDDIRARE